MFEEDDIELRLLLYLLGSTPKRSLTRFEYDRLIKKYNITNEELLSNDIQTILDKFPNEKEKNIREKLQSIKRFSRSIVELFPKAESEIASLKKQKIDVISFLSRKYPKKLEAVKKTRDSPPFLLYYKGSFKNINIERTVAIIGPRNPSRYALESTEIISRDLSSNGYTVVSGLAQGVDTEANRVAVEENGSTIAILGTGLYSIYPEENVELAKRIAERGLLLSQFRPNRRGARWTFAKRNRTIVGISSGTILIEGVQGSGTSYGAEATKIMGRPLFCLKPESPRSKGSFLPNQYLLQYLNAHEVTPENAFGKIKKIIEPNIKSKRNSSNGFS